MTILIPVDSKNRDECLISSIEENKAWAFIFWMKVKYLM